MSNGLTIYCVLIAVAPDIMGFTNSLLTIGAAWGQKVGSGRRGGRRRG